MAQCIAILFGGVTAVLFVEQVWPTERYSFPAIFMGWRGVGVAAAISLGSLIVSSLMV